MNDLALKNIKNNGIHFTGEKIVLKMLAEVCIKSTNRVLEPSVGEGIFLINYLSILNRQTPITNNNITPILENIFAYDIEPLFIETTKVNIISKINSLGVTKNVRSLLDKTIVVGDFLSASTGEFDLIIGNPPYVRTHNINQDTKKNLKDFSCGSGACDLSVYFLEKCLDSLSHNGEMIFVTSSKFTTAKYGKKIRTKMAPHLNYYSDLGDRAFSTAQIGTAIVKLMKTNSTQKKIKNKIIPADVSAIDFIGLDEWIFSDIGTQGATLGDFGISITNGIVSGHSKCHIITLAERKALIEKDPNIKNILRPAIGGRDIDLQSNSYSTNKYIILATFKNKKIIEKSSTLMDYFLKFELELKNRSWWKNNPLKPFFLLQGESQHSENGYKYVTKRIGSLKFIKIPDNIIYLDSVYCLISGNINIKHILEVLEDKDALDYFSKISNKLGGGIEIHKNKFERIPIPKNNPILATR